MVEVASMPVEIFSGSNLTLHCNVTLGMDLSGVQFNVSITWTGPMMLSQNQSQVKQTNDPPSQYMFQYPLNMVSLDHTGTYMCKASIVALSSMYLIPPTPTANSTEIYISKHTILCSLSTSGSFSCAHSM